MSKMPPLKIEGYVVGKFDHGYLFSAKVGDEWINGVLYHPADSIHAPAPPPTLLPLPVVQQQGSRNKKRKMGDHGPVKNVRNAYNYFVSEKYTEMKSLYPKMEGEFMKTVGQMWNEMSHDDKAVYKEKYANDKARYQRELAEYGLRLLAGMLQWNS